MDKPKLSNLLPRLYSFMRKSFIPIIALLFFFLAFELSLRIVKGCFVLTNFFTNRQRTVKYDPDLAWIPNPGTYKIYSKYKEKVTILEHGVRSNGLPILKQNGNTQTILAVGDSFTYGDHVSNAETWPSFLERVTNNKVINGGVCGYSFYQIVFRAEKLLNSYEPDFLIICFIPDDLFRSHLIEP